MGAGVGVGPVGRTNMLRQDDPGDTFVIGAVLILLGMEVVPVVPINGVGAVEKPGGTDGVVVTGGVVVLAAAEKFSSSAWSLMMCSS